MHDPMHSRYGRPKTSEKQTNLVRTSENGPYGSHQSIEFLYFIFYFLWKNYLSFPTFSYSLANRQERNPEEKVKLVVFRTFYPGKWDEIWVCWTSVVHGMHMFPSLKHVATNEIWSQIGPPDWWATLLYVYSLLVEFGPAEFGNHELYTYIYIIELAS